MLLAIDPTKQRRGIGKMLVQHGLELAAKDGKDVYLVATPAGKNLYRSLGFRDVTEGVELFGALHSSMLWKVPASAAS
jgi:ribosomal protein S18 acetylase RimI-like enzyme